MSSFSIEPDRFDDSEYIESRVAQASDEDQGKLRTALRYLYLTDGPVNLPRDRLLASEPYFDEAEAVLARWLYTRTNGSERRNYGQEALKAARNARYRCETCGFADVRCLNLDPRRRPGRPHWRLRVPVCQLPHDQVAGARLDG